MLKQQKGMTLFALVFTIIAMLALAAIAIAMVLDELKYDPEPVEVHTEQQVETSTPETTITQIPITDSTSNDTQDA